MRTIDLYIIRKFLGTFFFTLILLIFIVVIFDISERIDDFLRTLGCEEFQGYLFSRPVPADQAVKCFAGFTLPTAPDRSTP